VSYDPFDAGCLPVSVRTIQAADSARDRVFDCEIWSPVTDASGGSAPFPLIVFSHSSGGSRTSVGYLCTHLAGHGYVVAAMDHSETVAPPLAPVPDESAAQRGARVDAIISGRVPDVRFLLDTLLGGGGEAAAGGLALDADRIGLVGHSFGGWTALAVPEADSRVRAVVALAPGGSSRPRPGILPLQLTFDLGRDVPVLYLAAADDVCTPLDGVQELFGRTPGPKRMFVLSRADHLHFVDDVEREHEEFRAMTLPGDAAWIPGAMRPISELCPGSEAHDFVRGLTLAHLDASLRQSEAAERFLGTEAEAALAARGVDAAADAGC
jgi:predicted dienelactone hydrolase